MWCNNCCLCFPVRGGAMFLAGFVILVNAIGGVLLFLWGSYFFSSTMALIFGGFSAIQAVTAGIAFLGLCNWSYMMTRMYVFIQWLVAFLGVARIGMMAYQLQANKDRISGGCWGAVNDKGYSPQGTAAAFYCNTPIQTFIMLFIMGLVIDFVINLYMYFVVWRFYVRMRLYPFHKGVGLTYEQGLYEI